MSELAASGAQHGGVAARIVTVDDSQDPTKALAELGLSGGRPVLVLCGGAASLDDDPAIRMALAPVLGPSVLMAAARTGALVVDGGTNAGVVALLGQSASPEASAPLLGVAPAALVAPPGAHPENGRVALEPHHLYFVLTPGTEWGDETGWLARLSAAAAGDEQVAMVVAGGGAGTSAEIQEAVKRRWPIVLLEGTGGLADDLARRWRRAYTPPARREGIRFSYRGSLPPAAGPNLPGGGAADELDQAVIVGSFRLTRAARVSDLANALEWELRRHPVLISAWERFARYDADAVRLRRSFERSQLTILALGLTATLLALLLHALTTPLRGSGAWIATTMHWTVVSLPLLAAVLIAFADRFALGKRWVLLRGAAESIKGEIFRYRTCTGVYGDETESPESREQSLATRLAAVDTRLFGTEASSADVPVYSGPLPPVESRVGGADDGFRFLDAANYLTLRVVDQIRFYRSRTRQYGRRLRIIQAVILLAAAAAALLAAAGQEIWIGLMTALASAFAVHRSYLQLDATVVAYNQSASQLENLVSRWEALPVKDREAEYSWFVDQAEAVLQTELGAWIQQMNEALQTLRRQHAGEDKEPRAGR